MMIEKRDINETTTWNEIFRAMKLFNHPVCARADRARGVSRKIETSSRRDSRRAPCEAPGLPPLPPPLCSLPLLPPAPETALSAFLLEARGPRWRSAVLPTHRATQESSNHFLARSKKHLHLLRLLRSTSSASPSSSSSSSIFLSLSLPSLLSCVKCKNLER